jgi:exosortase N
MDADHTHGLHSNLSFIQTIPSEIHLKMQVQNAAVLSDKRGIPLLYLFAYLGMLFWFLSDYFIADFNVYMTIALSPFIMMISKGEYSYRYLWPALIFLLLSLFIPVRTVFYLSFIFCLLLLLESSFGKTGNLTLFMLLILSPVFRYFSSVFGFPVRLWLSKVTGSLLSLMGKDVSVAGNIIILDGSEFSVDPACTGLNMMAASFIIALFVMAHYQRKTGKVFSLWLVCALLTATLFLNVCCNLVRMLLLILFNLMPGNIMHDITGIVCLAIYVILPLLFISSRLFKAINGKHIVAIIPAAKKGNRLKIAINLFLVIALACSGIKSQDLRQENAELESNSGIAGYRKEILKTGIIKFENKSSLVYVKPVPFYAAEHNPMICWTGSGYEFEKVTKAIIRNIEVYTGVMKKGEEKIYTSWWFDNGEFRTANHWEWRTKAIMGSAPFSLVNVNASTEKELASQTESLLALNIFNHE